MTARNTGRFEQTRVFLASFSYLAGTGVTLLVGLFATPPTLRLLGTRDFGLLTLFWAVLTFLTNFDFGISQTLTKLLAASGRRSIDAQEARLAAAAFALQLLIGALLALAFLLGAALLPDETNREMIWHEHWLTFAIFLLSVPMLSFTVSCRATLEAKRDFQFVSALSLIGGLAQFLIPLACAANGFGIDAIVIGTVATRGGVMGAMLVRIGSHHGMRPRDFRCSTAETRRLWSVGSWIAYSTIINPALLYSDRFLLPFYFKLAEIVAYALPLEFLLRLMIFPAIINRVAFPYLNLGTHEDTSVRRRVYRTTALVMSAFGAALLLGAIAAPFFLELWLSRNFTLQSGRIAQIMLIGLSFSGVTYLSTGVMIAADRADFDPKVQLSILPFFIVALILVMRAHSLVMVAVVLSGRTILHSIVMLLAVRKSLAEDRWIAPLQILIHLAGALLVALVCMRG